MRKKEFIDINNFRIDRKAEDSYKLSLDIKNIVQDFVKQKIFLEISKEFSEIQKIPHEIVLNKSKQILINNFDYEKGIFKSNFRILSILKDSLVYLSIIIWGFVFSKKIKTDKEAELIIDDIGNHVAYERFKKLMKLSSSCIAINNFVIKNNFKENKITNLYFGKLFFFNSDCFYKNKIKNLKFFFKLVFFSHKYNFNFLYLLKIILYYYCKYSTIFSKYKSKYLLHDRFYRTCPIRNHFFKKNGGILTACTQKNICETTISFFVFIDTFLSLGKENYTQKRLIDLGGDIKNFFLQAFEPYQGISL